MSVPYHQVRARFDAETVTVYQAYPPHIAEYAAEHGRFGAGFKRERMTWIKPSFLWMMYRCGWALKPGQERVLAIDITRTGFEWALRHAALSHFVPGFNDSHEQWQASLRAPVRVQWDPERDVRLRELPYRSLQVGLSGDAVARYCDEWITGISDVTALARQVHQLLTDGDERRASAALPVEAPYPLPAEVAAVVDADG